MKIATGSGIVELRDGGIYEVTHPKKGTRRFRCIVEGDDAAIAFYLRDGKLCAYTTLNYLSEDEVRSLRPFSAGQTEDPIEVALLEGFDDFVEGIVRSLRAAGVKEMDLDEFVHDVANSLKAVASNHAGNLSPEELRDNWSEAGSSVNNAGMEAQVRALLRFHGVKEGIRIFRIQFGEQGFSFEMPPKLI